MSFERIGPYELTRGDLVAAALIISFFTAKPAVRLRSWLFLIIGVTLAGWGFLIGDLVLAWIGFLWVLFLFVIAPALRSRKRSRQIYLEYSPEGLVAETPEVRTTYKWATVGRCRKYGSRLFIMISDGCALVVSDRSTNGENMDRLIATLSEQTPALAG